MPDPLTRAEQIALLRQAIQSSGLSASAYARDVLTRDPRTVRRWLAGDSPIPRAVLDKLTPR
jgi:hypothetical protein